MKKNEHKLLNAYLSQNYVTLLNIYLNFVYEKLWHVIKDTAQPSFNSIRFDLSPPLTAAHLPYSYCSRYAFECARIDSLNRAGAIFLMQFALWSNRSLVLRAGACLQRRSSKRTCFINLTVLFDGHVEEHKFNLNDTYVWDIMRLCACSKASLWFVLVKR